MPGLVPGIHVFMTEKKDVDGRAKPGHDGSESITACLPFDFTPGKSARSAP